MSENAALVGRIPGDCDSRPDVTVVCVKERIATGVFDRTNADTGVKHLTLLGRLAFGFKVALSRKDFAGILVRDQSDAVQPLSGWRRPTVRQPITHRERWTHAPGILKMKLEVVHVGFGNEVGSKGQRFQTPVASAHNARIVQHAQRRSVKVIPYGYIRRAETIGSNGGAARRRPVCSGNSQVAAGSQC